MDDTTIIDLYWARSEQALHETELKYGAYCRAIPFRILYIPDKPTGVEALKAFQRHNADAIISIHGLTGKLLEYCHGDDRWHGIVIYRQKKAGAVGTMLTVDEKTVPPITAGCL